MYAEKVTNGFPLEGKHFEVLFDSDWGAEMMEDTSGLAVPANPATSIGHVNFLPRELGGLPFALTNVDN